jgi:hypothetical protein
LTTEEVLRKVLVGSWSDDFLVCPLEDGGGLRHLLYLLLLQLIDTVELTSIEAFAVHYFVLVRVDFLREVAEVQSQVVPLFLVRLIPRVQETGDLGGMPLIGQVGFILNGVGQTGESCGWLLAGLGLLIVGRLLQIDFALLDCHELLLQEVFAAVGLGTGDGSELPFFIDGTIAVVSQMRLASRHHIRMHLRKVNWLILDSPGRRNGGFRCLGDIPAVSLMDTRYLGLQHILD